MNTLPIIHVATWTRITKIRAFSVCSWTPSPLSFLLCVSPHYWRCWQPLLCGGNTNTDPPAPNLAGDLITQKTTFCTMPCFITEATELKNVCFCVSISTAL